MNAGRDAMDADVLLDEQRVTRTAKSCGPDASTLAFKLAGSIPPMTVTTKPDHRGDHVISRNTIARGMPGASGEPVVTTSCAFYFSHARLRVHRAPGIPCALTFLWAKDSCITRAHHAAGMQRCVAPCVVPAQAGTHKP